MIASLIYLHSDEVKRLVPEMTLFLFPVGGIENHGEYLPVGTKLMQAEYCTRQLAEKLQHRLPQWNFILLPLIPLTVDSVTNAFALNVRPHVVRDALVDQCEELKRVGFLNFAAVSAQMTPKQLSALEDAARLVSRAPFWKKSPAQLVSVSSAWVESKTVWESPMIALPAEHAGAKDTRFLLKEAPDHVRKQYAQAQPIPKPRASLSRFMAYLRREIDGYWGKPAEAQLPLEASFMSTEINTVTEAMIPWLEQGRGRCQFRSGYRYFPFNGSFFKAYLLAILFFLLMLFWVIWGVKDSFDV